MSDAHPFLPAPVFHGASQNATYRDPRVRRYHGNPLIEALPEIRSPEEAANLLAYYPKYDARDRKLPSEIRQHQLLDILHFFQPLPFHIDYEQRISRLLRDGYLGRNPLANDHWRQIDGRVAAIDGVQEIPIPCSTVNGFAMIGIPGSSKTSTNQRVLLTYPQVIYHQSHQGRPFNRVQVVWLMLTCPHDGSIKALCLQFFAELDALLHTNYYRDYAGNGRRTVDELTQAMARVAAIHCLGLLVIDEIQHLNESKSGGARRMLNFFLQLMNTLGLPVVLVGTYAALPILNSELRQIRRSSGMGDFICDRLQNDEAWQVLAESLWRYQYTQHHMPLTKELSDTLYDESVGIIDFAVKLFLLAQVRAISTGIEKVTPAVIRSVAKDSLRMAQPALRALRTGDMRAVSAMSDLHPIDFQSAVQGLRKSTLLASLATGTRLVSDINSAAALQSETESPASAGCAATTGSPYPPKRVSAKCRRPKAKGAPSKCLLVQVVEAGLAGGKSAHDALVEAGHIRPLFNTTGDQSLSA